MLVHSTYLYRFTLRGVVQRMYNCRVLNKKSLLLVYSINISEAASPPLCYPECTPLTCIHLVSCKNWFVIMWSHLLASRQFLKQ